MSTATMSADALTETLNGFDELAISKAFGEDITDLRAKPLMFLRALIFTERRREGEKDALAFKAAMEVRTVDLDSYFPEEPEEIDPDEPASAEGNDDEPPS